MKVRFQVYFLVSLLLFLNQGCATQSGFSKTFPRRLTETQQVWYFQNRAVQNLQTTSVPPAQKSVLTPYEIMERLLYVSPLRGHSVPVIVINDPKVNAQTDGKSIFINSGFVAAFGHDQNMVASVFAHELGHILANHQSGKPKGTSFVNYLGYLSPAFSFLPYGGLYGGLATTAVKEGVHMREYSYSRHQENEADAIGAWIAMTAGFNAMGLSDFLEYTGGSGFSVPKNISIPTSVGSIPQSVAVTLLSSSPLYQTHPPSKKRRSIVELVIQRKKGELGEDEMRKQARWLADLYDELEMRSPKTLINS